MSTSETRPVYPADREADIVLRDGSTVHVRPVRAEDRESVYAFLAGISQESIGFRFFAAANLKWATNWTVDVDYSARFGLVAETGSPSRIIAHGAYIGIDAERAEVAFLVADEWQGRGIATILLAHLADVAERHGFETFTAEVMPANHRMIEVFRESGFPIDMHSTRDSIEIELPTSLSPQALDRFEERERTAEALRAAEDALSRVQERGSESARLEAARAAQHARDAVEDAKLRVARAEQERARLKHESAERGADAERLEQRGAELAAHPRLEHDVATPATGLHGLLDWAARARGELLVSHAALATERDKIVREATELVASVLGEPLVTTGAAGVRQRLERALGDR